MHLSRASVDRGRIVIHPCGRISSGKAGLELLPAVLSSTGSLDCGGPQFLQHIYTGLDCLEADKGSQGPLDGLLDLSTGFLALVPHIVEVPSGIIGIISQAIELVGCLLYGPQEFSLDSSYRVSEGGPNALDALLYLPSEGVELLFGVADGSIKTGSHGLRNAVAFLGRGPHRLGDGGPETVSLTAYGSEVGPDVIKAVPGVLGFIPHIPKPCGPGVSPGLDTGSHIAPCFFSVSGAVHGLLQTGDNILKLVNSVLQAEVEPEGHLSTVRHFFLTSLHAKRGGGSCGPTPLFGPFCVVEYPGLDSLPVVGHVHFAEFLIGQAIATVDHHPECLIADGPPVGRFQ